MHTIRSLPVRCLPIGAALLVALSTAPSASADETIATLARPAPVSAYGGRVVWSSFDPARGAYVLMTRVGGVTSELAVRPRAAPFDVDLGADRDGRPIAAYSRCRHEPGRRDPAIGNVIAQLPQWSSGRGCDLYQFDFDRGRETRIRGASTSRASEFLPTIWGRQIAFARRYERRAGTAGKRAYLYRHSLVHERRRSRRLIAGLRSTQRFCSGRTRRCRRLIEPGPTALDLHERRLAVGWDSGNGDGPTSDVRLETIGSRRILTRLVSRFQSGEIQAAEIVSPSVDGGKLRWYLSRFGDTTTSLAQARVNGEVLQAAITPTPGDAFVRTVLSGSFDGQTGFYLLSGGTSSEPGCSPATPCTIDPACSEADPCELRTAPNIAFAPIP